MSIKAKKKKQEYRAKLKKTRKDQARALYQSYRDSGNNKKSKRSKLKAGRARAVRLVRHTTTDCGNPGCERCAPDLAAPKMNDSNDPRVRFRTTAQQKEEGVYVKQS